MERAGVRHDFLQENMSSSAATGTVRGLHFQKPPHGQAKLVSCLRGRILDCVVDLRRGAATFGQSLTVELTDAGEQLYVPVGYAHGFVTLEPDTLVSYRVSALYDPASEGGVAWNDPALAIDWPLPVGGPVVSDKDALLGPLADLDSPFADDGAGPMALRRL